MADQHRTPSFKAGDPWAQCDDCGFDWRHSQLRWRWDGVMTCPKCWEPRQSQDRPRTPRDRQAVINARPPNEIVLATSPLWVEYAGESVFEYPDPLTPYISVGLGITEYPLG